MLPCGHPDELLVKSVESDHQFCELCECRDRLRDALEMERSLSADLKATIAFLTKACDGRIVSSNDMNDFQISEARINGRFFVEPGGGLGWASIPWDLSTAKDRMREADYFSRNNMMV